MKKLFLYAAVAALAMTAASCQREILIDNGLNDSLVFAASIDGRLDTKTTLSGTTISWESTDSITVNGVVYEANSNSDGYYFTKKNSKDANPTSPYKAFYPTGIQTGTTNSGTLPATQTYAAGHITNVPMFATSDTTSLSFQTICAVLAITVDNSYISQIKSIRVSSSNRAMSGAFTIGTNSKAVLTDSLTTDNTVTLNCESAVTTTSAGTVFYIAIPAQTYQNLTIELSEDGSSYTAAMMTKRNENIGVSVNKAYLIDFKDNSREFSVSDTKKVKFTKGNLYWDGTKFCIESTQTAYPESWKTSHVGHFYWTKTAAASYAESYSDGTCATSDVPFFAENVGGLTVDDQSGLYALTKDEWTYLLSGRTGSSNLYKAEVTIAGKVPNCLVIAPDRYRGSIKESYLAEEWDAAESAGLVCLPPAGYRLGSSFSDSFYLGFYQSATPSESDKDKAYYLYISSYADIAIPDNREKGYPIRLVSTVSE